MSAARSVSTLAIWRLLQSFRVNYFAAFFCKRTAVTLTHSVELLAGDLFHIGSPTPITSGPAASGLTSVHEERIFRFQMFSYFVCGDFHTTDFVVDLAILKLCVFAGIVRQYACPLGVL